MHVVRCRTFCCTFPLCFLWGCCRFVQHAHRKIYFGADPPPEVLHLRIDRHLSFLSHICVPLSRWVTATPSLIARSLCVLLCIFLGVCDATLIFCFCSICTLIPIIPLVLCIETYKTLVSMSEYSNFNMIKFNSASKRAEHCNK